MSLEELSWVEGGGGGGARYESRARGLYNRAYSAEALDNAPLLGDEAYTEIPVCEAAGGEGAGAGGGGGAGADWAGHCHWKGLPEPPGAVPQLVAALALCGFFMVCELVGGYLAGSLAIMCDAAHLLSDCGGFGLALLALHLAERPADARLSYGYRRAEVLGAMASVLLIWVLTGVLVWVACARLRSGDYHIDPDTMMLVSGAGVLVNILMALVLHGSCPGIAHAHSHGGGGAAHAHEKRTEVAFRGSGRSNGELALRERAGGPGEPMSRKGERGAGAGAGGSGSGGGGGRARNINLRAALVHVLGDLIQSCGVFLAALIIKFYPAWKAADPACTFLFSLLVLGTTLPVLRDALAVLMQAVPHHFPYRECSAALRGVPGVRGVHSLHVWGLSTHHAILTAHVAIDEFAEWESVLAACVRVARRLGAQAATLQVERHRPAMAACGACASPAPAPAP